jgi:hypothetical protein
VSTKAGEDHLPDDTAVDAREARILFVRLPSLLSDADGWMHALHNQVLAPLHEVVPVSDVLVEEDIRGPLEAPRLL